VKFTPRSFGENYGREEALGERYGVCFVTPYLFLGLEFSDELQAFLQAGKLAGGKGFVLVIYEKHIFLGR